MEPPAIDQFVTFIYAPDLDQTAAFYQDTLGLPLILDQGSCRIFQVGQNAFLGICQAGGQAGRTATPAGSLILTLVTDRVDAWHDYLLTKGIPIEKPPSFNPTYNIYHLFFRDPNGLLLEFQTFLDPAWPRPVGPTD